jgi:hypothetical protein
MCRAALRRVEVVCQLEHRGLVERRLAVWIAAGSEHEERTANRGIPLVLGELDRLAGEVCEDDLLYVSRPGTRLRNSRA